MKRNFTIPLLILLGAVSMATAGLNQIPLYLRSGLDSAVLATGGQSCTTKWYVIPHIQVMAIAFQMREATGHTDAIKPVIGVQYGLADTIKCEKTFFSPTFDRSATVSVAPTGDTLLVGYGPYAFVLPPCAWVRFRIGTTVSYANNVTIKQPWVYTFDGTWTGFNSVTTSSDSSRVAGFSDSARIAGGAYLIEGKDTTWIKNHAGIPDSVRVSWWAHQLRGDADSALIADTTRGGAARATRALTTAQADSADRAHLATIADSAAKTAYADSCRGAAHAMLADSVPHPLYGYNDSADARNARLADTTHHYYGKAFVATSGGTDTTRADSSGIRIFDGTDTTLITAKGIVSGESTQITQPVSYHAGLRVGSGYARLEGHMLGYTSIDSAIILAHNVTWGEGAIMGCYTNDCVVSGGRDSKILGSLDCATIGGGRSNFILNAWQATIGGGINNYAIGDTSTIAGGGDNSVTNRGATVSGGSHNLASGLLSTCPGGSWDTAAGAYSIAAGYGSHAGSDTANFHHNGPNSYVNKSDYFTSPNGYWLGTGTSKNLQTVMGESAAAHGGGISAATAG